MKSRLLAVLVFLFMFSEVYNYPITFNKAEHIEHLSSDSDAVRLLKSVYKKYSSYRSLKMDLDITIKDGDFSYKKTGSAFVKGDKYRLETNDEKIVSDGESLWVYLKSSESLQIVDASTQDRNFFCYPAMVLQKYQKYCVVKHLNEEDDQLVVLFTAYNNECPYQSIKVFIDKATYNINKIEALETANIGYTVVVKKFNETDLQDQSFVFDENKVKVSTKRDFRKN